MTTTDPNAPFTPAVFHILFALSSGERHGRGILKQVEPDSQLKFKMGPGTLVAHSSACSMHVWSGRVMFNPTMVRKLYRKLLTLYPREFREQLGESMEQTFNDLYTERQAGGGSFGFVLWTFADTLIGIMKEERTFMTPTFKIFGTAIISAIVAVATIATAWLLKGSAYENTFFYVFAIGLVLIAAFEVYSTKKNKK